MKFKSIIILALAFFVVSCGSKQEKETFTINGVSFNMIYVQVGTSQMGSNNSETQDHEMPDHSVTLSEYYIGETEVTQALWEAVMGNNPSRFNGSDKPVENVSWEDCLEFVKKLNKLTGKNFSLPTEVVWKYAACGGNKSNGYKYSGSDNIDDVAWYGGNASSTTHPVGTKSPNELGLYDMSGNVFEWCGYSRYRVSSLSSQTNLIGPVSSRGGSWRNSRVPGTGSSIHHSNRQLRRHDLGFRLVMLID